MARRIYIRPWGGLGDVTLSTPVFEELKNKFPKKKIVVLCVSKKYEEILANNPHIDYITSSRILLYCFLILNRLRFIHINHLDYWRLFQSISNPKKSASDAIAEMLDIDLKNTKLQIYLTTKEDQWGKKFLSKYENPIILHISSLTSPNHMWSSENWEELVERMKECTFIQLGTASETRINGAIDLRSKTTIREAFAIIKHARSFVGVDSFFSHVTNAFDKKGVVLFGPSSVWVWGHDNNNNISKNLPCSPCIEVIRDAPCPYNQPCLKSITVNEVRDSLNKLLHN